MEQVQFQFDQLIECQIKRLTRPKFRQDYEQYYDRDSFQKGDGCQAESDQYDSDDFCQVIRDEQTLQNLMARCDISYDGVPFHSQLSFNASFGKISMGETFKALFTFQNKNTSYGVDELRIKTTLEKVPKNKSKDSIMIASKDESQVLMDFKIGHLNPKQQQGQIIKFKVDSEDQYNLNIDLSYTSKYFSEQLKGFQQLNEDMDVRELQRLSNAQIDTTRGKVIQTQTKKYKFDAMLPFEVSKHVILRNNKFIMQVKVTNASVNKVFPEQILFLVKNFKLYNLIDLNENVQEKSVVFHPNEIRSFIFILEPIDPLNHKINKFQEENLGFLELKWNNYFGDPGLMKVGPFKYTNDVQSRLQIEIKQLQDQNINLTLEQPQDMKFLLFNLSQQNMNLKLSIHEDANDSIKILSFEPQGSENIGLIKPGKSQEFVLKLFPLSCGLLPVTGLIIEDCGNEKVNYQNFCKIYVDKQ